MASESKSVAEKLLMKDYAATLAFVDKLDGQLFAIRNLAVVSVSAVIAYTVAQHRRTIVLANIVVVPAFMLLELVYKCFHEDGIQRIWELEVLIPHAIETGKLPEHYRFGIGHAIRPATARALFEIATNNKRWHIRLLYLLLFLMSAVAYWYTTASA